MGLSAKTNILLVDLWSIYAGQIEQLLQSGQVKIERCTALPDSTMLAREYNLAIVASDQNDQSIIAVMERLFKHATCPVILVTLPARRQAATFALQHEQSRYLSAESVVLIPDLVTQIIRQNENAQKRLSELKHQNDVIVSLATHPDLMHLNWEAALQVVTKTTTDTLSVSRMSVWLYNDDKSMIFCEMLHNRTTGTFERGLELTAEEYPAYFSALHENRVIVANDAHRDSSTREFSGGYLDKHEIVSMLDAPVRVQGKMVGMVCNEHTQNIRKWTVGDQHFAAAIADLVAQLIENRHRREMEQELLRRESYLEEAEAIAHVGHFELDLETGDLLWSDETYRIFEMPLGTPVTIQHYESLLPPKDYARIYSLIVRSIQTRERYEIEHDFVSSNGSYKRLFARALPVENKKGEVVKIFGIIQDITRLKEAENERLELQLERTKFAFLKDFVDSMTHDLKTPLTGIKSVSYLLKRTTNDPKQLTYLSQLDAYASRVQKMIDDILVVSRLDHVQNPEFEQRDINGLVIDVAETFRTQAENSELELVVDISEDTLPVTIVIDDFERALSNLVENAINYTPVGGRVTVTTKSLADRAIVEVRDTGIGIPQEDMPQIFTQFFRSDNARSFELGTGLGLAIVKKIVELNNGTIEVSSEVNGGSIFTIAVPQDA